MKARFRPSDASAASKTDIIATAFTADPFRVLSPKMISEEIGMDLRTVTSIVNRLRDEGSIERVGWGRYRLRTGIAFDEATVSSIAHDMLSVSSDALGISGKGIEVSGDGLSPVLGVYGKLKGIGGEIFATNILRICARKSLGDERTEAVVSMVKGSAGMRGGSL